MANFELNVLTRIGTWREFTLQQCGGVYLLFHNDNLIDIVDKEMAEELKKKGVKEKKY